MGRIILLLFAPLLLFSGRAVSQKVVTGSAQKEALIGLWQDHSDEVGSWLGDHFRFYKDGHFTYGLDDALNPIRSILEDYYIKNSVLFLKVTSIKELTGARVVAPEPAIEFGTFRLHGGQVTTIEQKDAEFEDRTFKMIESAGKMMIQIDDGKY